MPYPSWSPQEKQPLLQRNCSFSELAEQGEQPHPQVTLRIGSRGSCPQSAVEVQLGRWIPVSSSGEGTWSYPMYEKTPSLSIISEDSSTGLKNCLLFILGTEPSHFLFRWKPQLVSFRGNPREPFHTHVSDLRAVGNQNPPLSPFSLLPPLLSPLPATLGAGMCVCLLKSPTQASECCPRCPPHFLPAHPARRASLWTWPTLGHPQLS